MGRRARRRELMLTMGNSFCAESRRARYHQTARHRSIMQYGSSPVHRNFRPSKLVFHKASAEDPPGAGNFPASGSPTVRFSVSEPSDKTTPASCSRTLLRWGKLQTPGAKNATEPPTPRVQEHPPMNTSNWPTAGLPLLTAPATSLATLGPDTVC
jgi:hypothetical protein